MTTEMLVDSIPAMWRWPAVAPDTIDRRRLDHHYASATGRLIRVMGPPGYGKSSLAARWVSADPRPVRWVDLDRSDDDPVTLFDTLRRALDGVVTIGVPSAVHARGAEPYVRALDEAMATLEPRLPFVLVLDDVHRVRSLGGHRLIQTFVEGMPPDSTVVAVGRGYHDHGTTARLRLAPGVIDIATSDLALEGSEAHELLHGMGVDVHTPRAAQLLSDLEGWPAGVRLAGQVLRSGTSVDHINDHVSLADYLRGEWVGQLDEEVRTFLMEIACLQRFTGQQCDEVLERAGSRERLRQLHRDQVVVFALDQRDEWFRLHGLLARWLSAELRDADPQRWERIHLRAAGYLEARGEIDRAVEHARAVGDLDLLENIVSVHGGDYFSTGRETTVEKWLEAFPRERLLQSPRLASLQCVNASKCGDEPRALEWLRVLDEAAGSDRGHEGPAKWWTDVLHSGMDERPASELIPTVASARPHLARTAWSPFACWVLGSLSFLNGDVDGAREVLRAGAFEGELLETFLLSGHCSATLSILDDCVGEQASAAEHAQRAMRSLESNDVVLLAPSAAAMAVAALQHARHGDREAAELRVASARDALTGFRSSAPWLNVTARLALIRTVLLLDKRDVARELVQELRYHLRFEPVPTDSSPPSAVTCAHELYSQVEAMHLPAIGASALTEAELRVLRLLPTHLSLIDIASQLFVSPNTVKSQAASIYRKLEVNKRADAVDRARHAGLLSDTHPM